MVTPISIQNFFKNIATPISLFLERQTNESVSGALLLIGSTWSLVKTIETTSARKLVLDGPSAKKMAQQLKSKLTLEIIESNKKYYNIRPKIQNAIPIIDLLKQAQENLEISVHNELNTNYQNIHFDHNPMTNSQKDLVQKLTVHRNDEDSLRKLKIFSRNLKSTPSTQVSQKAIDSFNSDLVTFEEKRDPTIFKEKLDLADLLSLNQLFGAISMLKSNSPNYQTQVDKLKNIISNAKQKFPQLPLEPLAKGVEQLSPLPLEDQVGNFTSTNKGVVKVFEAITKLVEVTKQNAFGEDEKLKIIEAAHCVDESLQEFKDPLLLKKAEKLAATKNWEVVAPLFCAGLLALISSRLSYQFPHNFFAKMKWLQL